MHRTAGTVAAYDNLPLCLYSEIQCKRFRAGCRGKRGIKRTARPRPSPTEDVPQDGMLKKDEVSEKRIRRV